MKYYLVFSVLVVVFFSTSCSNYKAKLIVTVKDSSDKKLSKAYVFLLTEQHARAFEKGIDKEPNYYAVDSTNSSGVCRIKVLKNEPIYGIAAKQGYYYQEFFIESPLENKLKGKLEIKLGAKKSTSMASAITWEKQPNN